MAGYLKQDLDEFTERYHMKLQDESRIFELDMINYVLFINQIKYHKWMHNYYSMIKLSYNH
jgi:hypothetical protein